MIHSSDADKLERARREALPAALREALGDAPAYLVGGAVRDALLARPLGDLDIAVDAELEPILERAGAGARSHERFATASLELDGRGIDLARTRRETYAHPGALPTVSPAPIRADLARRDFTVNALAIPLAGELELIDPYDGQEDLRAGLLRTITPESFVDDPTRALRAARYAARLDLDLEPETESALRATDLSAVSRDRVEADLRRIAAEPGPVALRAFGLLDSWGLLELGPERRRLLEGAAGLCAAEPWADAVEPTALLYEIATAGPERLEEAATLAAADASRLPPSELYELAAGRDQLLLAVARAMGAGWLDRHMSEWLPLRMSIDGDDLLAAGVPQGPELGRALRAAHHDLLDGRIEPGREGELRAALAAAGRGADG